MTTHLFYVFACLTSLLSVRAALPPHPRVVLTDEALTVLRSSIISGGEPRTHYTAVLTHGLALLSQPPISYPNCTVVGACRNAAIFGNNAGYINDGGARDVIQTCALLHRLGLDNSTGGGPTIWSTRALLEIDTLVGFPSWYWPVGQALERAGMAYAAAIGYDWLYTLLSPAQRDALETAIGSLVLHTRENDEFETMWWTQDIYNWNINSQAPMLAATIALADAPAWSALAARVQRYILASMPHALATFAPDGVWPESPGYQGYTVSELVHGAAALISATGSDEGLLGGPGVCGTGIVSAYNAGPSLNIFNRGDSTPTHPSSDQLFFLSQHCRMPVYAALARTFYNGAGSASAESDNLIWFSGAGSDADILALPLARAFVDPSLDRSRGAKTHFVSFREAWLQPNASWVALKGGDNYFYDGGSNSHNNHGHLDVGAFVLESNGVRWAVELGSGAYDYPLLAYFGRFRFGYAFTSSVTHNVLRFDDVTQNRRGQGRIVATSDAVALNDHDAASASVAAAAGVPAWALFDTTSAYGGAVTVLRNVSLSGRITTVADSWIHPFATSAYFQFATTSSVSLHGSSATLYDAETGSSLLVTATAARGGRIEWTAPRLQLKVPQIDTYDGLLVYMVTIEVPATEGGVSVSFEPVPLAMKQ